MKFIGVKFTKENLKRKEMTITLSESELESIFFGERFKAFVACRYEHEPFIKSLYDRLYESLYNVGIRDITMKIFRDNSFKNNGLEVCVNLSDLSASALNKIIGIGFSECGSSQDDETIKKFSEKKHPMVVFEPCLIVEKRIALLIPNEKNMDGEKLVNKTLKHLKLKKYLYMVETIETLDSGYVKTYVTFSDFYKAIKRLKELIKSEEVLCTDATYFTIERVYEFNKKGYIIFTLPIVDEITKPEEIKPEKEDKGVVKMENIEKISLDIVKMIYDTADVSVMVKKHRIEHLERVLSISREISKNISRPKNINQNVLTIASLCHDMAKYIDKELHGEIGASIFPIYAEKYLDGLTKKEIKSICDVIKGHNVRLVDTSNRERKIVSDADLIDKLSVCRYDRDEITKEDIEKLSKYEEQLYYRFSKELFRHRLLVLKEYSNCY